MSSAVLKGPVLFQFHVVFDWRRDLCRAAKTETKLTQKLLPTLLTTVLF